MKLHCMKSRGSGRKPNQHLASPRHSPASAYCTFDFLTMPTVLHFQTNHVAQTHINSSDRHHRRKSYGRPGARAFRREQKVAASLGASEASLRKQLRLRTVPTSPGRYKPTFSPERGRNCPSTAGRWTACSTGSPKSLAQLVF